MYTQVIAQKDVQHIFCKLAEHCSFTELSFDIWCYAYRFQIVDFVIWSLCSKRGKAGTNGQHLLCRGFRKTIGILPFDRHKDPTSAIPGLIPTFVNNHVTRIRSAPWPAILVLMGRAGEKSMIDLLMDCDLFLAVNAGQGNYEQLSGIKPADNVSYSC